MTFEKLLNFKEQKQWIWLSIIVISSVFILFSIVNFYYFFHRVKPQTTRAHLPQTKTATVSNDLLSYPLFGQFLPENSKKIPKTLLNLKLIGILKASNPSRSQATISVNGGHEQNYFIGQILPGDAKIIRIDRNGLLISREGHIERLSLPRPKLPPLIKPKPLEFKP